MNKPAASAAADSDAVGSRRWLKKMPAMDEIRNHLSIMKPPFSSPETVKFDSQERETYSNSKTMQIITGSCIPDVSHVLVEADGVLRRNLLSISDNDGADTVHEDNLAAWKQEFVDVQSKDGAGSAAPEKDAKAVER